MSAPITADDIAAATERLAEARIERDALIGIAHDQGMPVTKIAAAAKVTRATVYRLVGGRAFPAGLPRDRWAGVLHDAALELVANGGSQYEASKILQTPGLDMKAKRLQLMMKNMPTLDPGLLDRLAEAFSIMDNIRAQKIR